MIILKNEEKTSNKIITFEGFIHIAYREIYKELLANSKKYALSEDDLMHCGKEIKRNIDGYEIVVASEQDLLDILYFDWRQLENIPEKEQTQTLCWAALQRNPQALQYVINQTEDMCLNAVKKDSWTLRFVKEQTIEICTEAVKHDGLALQFAKEQTHDMCIMAIKQNVIALKFVKKQTPEMIKIALEQDPAIARKYANPDILSTVTNQRDDVFSTQEEIDEERE